MKKITTIIATVALFGALATTAVAGTVTTNCVTNKGVVMYVDAYRAAAWMNALAVSYDDAYKLMLRDGREGSAVFIPKGTRIEWYEHIPKDVTIVGINGKKYFAVTKVVIAICR